MELFDTHSHLDDEQLLPQVEDVIGRATDAGVRTMIAVGTTAASSTECVRLAERFDGVFAAVGIQPNYGAEATESEWDQIEQLSQHARVVAIGETGLDAYWDFTPFDEQRTTVCPAHRPGTTPEPALHRPHAGLRSAGHPNVKSSGQGRAAAGRHALVYRKHVA